MKKLSRSWLGAPYYEQELKKYLPSKDTSYARIPLPILAKYNARDSLYTAKLYPTLSKVCRENGTYEYAHKLLMPAQLLFGKIESHGMRLDMSHAADIEEEWVPRIKTAEAAMKEYAEGFGFTVDKCREAKAARTGKPVPADKVKDQSFNVRSTDHLSYLCHDVLRMRKGETSPRSCDASFMKENEGHEFIELLKEHRRLDHLHKAFVVGIVDDMKADGRIHPQHMFGAVTGRLTCYNPPMQTLPHHSIDAALAALVRRLFLPDEGCLFVNADYSQQELRVAAYLSQDPVFIADVKRGSFHKYGAAGIFHKEPKDVTGLEKFLFKFIIFGLMYGGTAYALAGAVNAGLAGQGFTERVTPEEVQVYINGILSRFSVYSAWRNEQMDIAVETGVLRTPLGRMRRWDLISPDLVDDIRKQASNFGTQSVASDLCTYGAIRLQEFFERENVGHVHALVHDAIPSSVRESESKWVLPEMKRIMVESAYELLPDLNVPLDAAFEVGPNYGDVEEIKL